MHLEEEGSKDMDKLKHTVYTSLQVSAVSFYSVTPSS